MADKERLASFLDDLRMLETHGVGVTAEVSENGDLSPVGGLWAKLGKQTIDLARRGLLHVVVVAENQADVPDDYIDRDDQPLCVIKARTVADAIHQLNAQTLPRRAVREHERLACEHLDMLGHVAPIETLYQVTPLLREVKPSRSLPGMDAENAEAVYEVELSRWEEEFARPGLYQTVDLAEVFAQARRSKEGKEEAPRFVVIGPPGSGKSTLQQYLAWQAVQGRLQVCGRQLLPIRIRLQDWEAGTTREGLPEQDLVGYLTMKYQRLNPAPSDKLWKAWLHRGEVLLLFDGLDEIEGKALFINIFKRMLTDFPQCSAIVTCRTVSLEQHRSLCPDFPVFTVAGLSPGQREAFIRAFPGRSSTHYNPEQLIEQLKHLPQLSPLTANPLLLGVICYVGATLEKSALPTTRAELYDKVAGLLLERNPKRVTVHYPGEEPSLAEKAAVLGRVALQLFMAGGRRLTFTDQELTEAFKQALSEEGYGEAPAAWANALRKDVEQNSGIMQGNPRQGFFFFHLTVHEFLAASALANIVNKNGWETPIQKSGKPVSVARLMDRKAWEPAWQEVFSFLTGKLDAPLPLLSRLADKNRDDLFRHRLALAAMCLPEALAKLGQQPSVSDRITNEMLAVWVQHEQEETLPTVSHFTRTLPALGQVEGKIAGIPLLDWCCQQLRELNPDSRAAAVELMGLIGETVARRPVVLVLLTKILRDSRTDVVARAKTVTALRRIGPVASQQHPDLLSALEHVALHDANWFVRSEAIRAIEQMGSRVVEEAGKGRDATALRGVNTTSLTNQGHMSFSQNDLATLLQTLSNENLLARAQALSTLERLGASAAQCSETIPALIQVALHDRNSSLRAHATRVLGQLGRAVADHPSGLPTLVQVVVRDKDVGVRAQALHALGEIGDMAIRYPEVIPTLLNALQDEEGDVRFSASEALEKIMAQGVRIFQRKWKGIGRKRLEVKRVDELATL